MSEYVTSHRRLVRLLHAAEQTLQADLHRGVDVEQLLADHARRLHGRHCAAVHEDVRDALSVIGHPGGHDGRTNAGILLHRVRLALSTWDPTRQD